MKTAVEYLEEEIKISNKDTFYDLVESIEVAKKMERKQMIDLVKYILKEVDFDEIIIPYEIVDLYQIADDRKQKSEGKNI